MLLITKATSVRRLALLLAGLGLTAVGAEAAPVANDLSIRDVKTGTLQTASAAPLNLSDPQPVVRRAQPQAAASSSEPSRDVKAVIDLSDQRMTVYIDGNEEYTWKISSARRGYETPNGTYQPQWLSRMHYSKKYDNAPMPYSVFFSGGYAIHGTDSIYRLGQPASHGCIRLHPDNAKTFYDLVRTHGKTSTTISIVGSPQFRDTYVAGRSRGATDRVRPVYALRDTYSVPDRADREPPSRSADSGCLACEKQMARFRPFSIDHYNM